MRNQRDYHLTRHGHAARANHFPRRRPRPCPAMDIAQPARGTASLPAHRSGEQLAGVHRSPPRLQCADAELRLCRCRRQHRLLRRRDLFPSANRAIGAVPVPGSTDDYDWTGFIPFDDLPHSFNPPSGMIATANGRIVPDNYPYFITARWEAPFRTARIFQLLARGGRLHSIGHAADSDRCPEPRRCVAGQTTPRGRRESKAFLPDAQFALSLLKNWDGEARVGFGRHVGIGGNPARTAGTAS